jgi:Zn finger protein HypA/HybF involved in hydrogenase expression
MHETHILENIFQYLDKEEKSSSRRIKKICVSLSEFGTMSEEVFKEQYRRGSAGTKWESLEIEIKKIPFGPELEITRLDFA